MPAETENFSTLLEGFESFLKEFNSLFDDLKVEIDDAFKDFQSNPYPTSYFSFNKNGLHFDQSYYFVYKRKEVRGVCLLVSTPNHLKKYNRYFQLCNQVSAVSDKFPMMVLYGVFLNEPIEQGNWRDWLRASVGLDWDGVRVTNNIEVTNNKGNREIDIDVETDSINNSWWFNKGKVKVGNLFDINSRGDIKQLVTDFKNTSIQPSQIKG